MCTEIKENQIKMNFTLSNMHKLRVQFTKAGKEK